MTDKQAPEKDANFAKLDEEKIKENIEKYSSEKLADMIITHRYLPSQLGNIFEGPCTIAMEELTKRRLNGDNFQYEKYIAENLATLPKLEFSKTLNFNSLFQMLKVKK